MALFKVNRGPSSNLGDVPFHDGWAYFTPDDSGFYIDAIYDDAEEVRQHSRIKVNNWTDVNLTGTPVVPTIKKEMGSSEIVDIDDNSKRIVNTEWINTAFDVMLGPDLVSISVTTPPNQTVYYSGEELDLTGIVVSGTYSDSSIRILTEYCVFTPPEGTVLTTDIDIDICYDTLHCKQSITVL